MTSEISHVFRSNSQDVSEESVHHTHPEASEISALPRTELAQVIRQVGNDIAYYKNIYEGLKNSTLYAELGRARAAQAGIEVAKSVQRIAEQLLSKPTASPTSTKCVIL